MEKLTSLDPLQNKEREINITHQAIDRLWDILFQNSTDCKKNEVKKLSISDLSKNLREIKSIVSQLYNKIKTYNISFSDIFETYCWKKHNWNRIIWRAIQLLYFTHSYKSSNVRKSKKTWRVFPTYKQIYTEKKEKSSPPDEDFIQKICYLKKELQKYRLKNNIQIDLSNLD